jgi:hypothetical protein
LSLPASQLENRAGTQQHHQSTNEKYWHGGGFARRILQSSVLGFGDDGPYQWHFLLRIRRLTRLRRVIADCRRLARVQIRDFWGIGRGRGEICRRYSV